MSVIEWAESSTQGILPTRACRREHQTCLRPLLSGPVWALHQRQLSTNEVYSTDFRLLLRHPTRRRFGCRDREHVPGCSPRLRRRCIHVVGTPFLNFFSCEKYKREIKRRARVSRETKRAQRRRERGKILGREKCLSNNTRGGRGVTYTSEKEKIKR